jgi:hypothetical protein
MSRLEQPDHSLREDGYEMAIPDTFYLEPENGGARRLGVRVERVGGRLITRPLGNVIQIQVSSSRRTGSVG